MADYLRNQNYVVAELYDQQATKHNIMTALHSVALQLTAEDRVVVFMAGHGTQERHGDEIWGSFIPYDGTDPASYVAYPELQEASRHMQRARHQLFLLDAGLGGLRMRTRRGGVSPDLPNYIDEITKRITREVLTAGTETQEALDTEPNGHSVFTSALLEGLGGAADLNRDGYITFAELESYLVPRASHRLQTPASGSLPGHEGGEFVFRSPLARTGSLIPAESISKIVVKGSDTQQLAEAKELLQESRFLEALFLFRESASTDNPEALFYLGRLHANGWGVPRDYAQARQWYEMAAAGGNADAMSILGFIYSIGRGVPQD
ncbi:MAG: SEL1-like repeat protein, partial [Verrucomicrobia bacterium]|nr:SEL1-like repeat protein [Verrucomicrobiota bacterium]